MIPKATPQAIKSIVRRATLKSDSKLNILTFCTHERYEQNLCRTGHTFYSLKHGKTWNTDYGDIPENYHEISQLPFGIQPDLILSHTSCERLGVAKQIQYLFNIPILRHTHVLPDIRFDLNEQVQGFNSVAVEKNTFISKHNMLSWGCNEHNSAVIEHGIDHDFWANGDDLEKRSICLSVVNEWPTRDWCCGWELWQEIVGFVDISNTSLPVKVLGNNSGISKAAPNINELRKAYQSSLIFLNTSIHSPVPTALMEAMASGCAIVSTNNCMIPEIIQHGHNGLLGNSAAELRSHCQDLINNPDKAIQLGKNAQETIKEKYSLSRFVSSWNSCFSDLITNYRI